MPPNKTPHIVNRTCQTSISKRNSQEDISYVEEKNNLVMISQYLLEGEVTLSFHYVFESLSLTYLMLTASYSSLCLFMLKH